LISGKIVLRLKLTRDPVLEDTLPELEPAICTAAPGRNGCCCRCWSCWAPDDDVLLELIIGEAAAVPHTALVAWDVLDV